MTNLYEKYNTVKDREAEPFIATKYFYFKFNFEDRKKVIILFKKGHMVKNVILNVEQAFLPPTTKFSLHFKGSELGSVANGDLSTSRAFNTFIGDNHDSQDMLNVLKEDKYLMFTIIGENYTQGKGWGLIEYIDMSQVPGYRRL